MLAFFLYAVVCFLRLPLPARKGRLWDRDHYRDLSTAIAGNGLELEEHNTSSERIACDLELGRSIATQPIWFLAALEFKLILDGFLNDLVPTNVAKPLANENEFELSQGPSRL